MIRQKLYFVYRITNKLNGKIYIGCHETLDLDDGYMGSGKYIIRAYKKYGIENFYKDILNFYPDRDSMFNAEKIIINREFIKEDSNYNLAEGGRGGFKGEECYSSIERSKKLSLAKINTIAVIDKFGNKFRVDSSDSRLITKELVGHTNGLAAVKDSSGKGMMVPVDDPRIKSGELVGVTKGLAAVKDSSGKGMMVPVDDPRIKSGELVGVTKGSIQSIESNRKRSETLKGIKRIPIYVSCIFCKKSTILTNIIRWHMKCC